MRACTRDWRGRASRVLPRRAVLKMLFAGLFPRGRAGTSRRVVVVQSQLLASQGYLPEREHAAEDARAGADNDCDVLSDSRRDTELRLVSFRPRARRGVSTNR